MIQIVSKKDGFRRGGVAHPGKPKDYPDDFFSKDQLEAIEKEPMLFVTHLPDSPKIEALEKKEPVSGINTGTEKESDSAKDQTGKNPDLQALINAGKQAIEAGGTIQSGAPSVEAMEDILGRKITMEDRNQAWMAIQAEKE